MANPLTCQHNVISVGVNTTTFIQWIFCVSCNTRMTLLWINGRHGKYIYDKQSRNWIYMSKLKLDILAGASDEIMKGSMIAVIGTDKTIDVGPYSEIEEASNEQPSDVSP